MNLATLHQLRQTQINAAAGGYTDPPLVSNTNDEIFNFGGAVCFLPDETDDTLHPSSTATQNASEASVADTSGYGDFVHQCTATGTNQARTRFRFTGGEFTAGSTYDYAFLYRMNTGTAGQLRITSRVDNSSTTSVQITPISTTDWTVETGSFTVPSGSNVNYIEFTAYSCYSTGLGGQVGDVIEFKMSCKLQ